MNNKGVSLIELLVVIVVMGIIGGFSFGMVSNILENTRQGVDEQTVSTLNTATNYYSFYNHADTVFDVNLTDSEKLILLYNEGYVGSVIKTQSKDAVFIWSEEQRIWRLNLSGTAVALSPYGDTYTEIIPNIISDIQQRLVDEGSYGRSWGDYQYTDVGLDPEDWENPILHILYRPSGVRLILNPEDGYAFTVYNSNGDEFYMPSTRNWNIFYNDENGFWYFHSENDENIIDITTLVVEPY